MNSKVMFRGIFRSGYFGSKVESCHVPLYASAPAGLAKQPSQPCPCVKYIPGSYTMVAPLVGSTPSSSTVIFRITASTGRPDKKMSDKLIMFRK